jgi:hypothetical protein
MSEKDVRSQLLDLWEEIKSNDILEGLLDMADDLIKENPECTDVLIEQFHKESSLNRKELLAQMILYGVHYKPAIDFLRNERGWDDFTGYAGFPEG